MTNAYSAPLKAGTEVHAKVYASRVELWHDGRCVARHERCYPKPHRSRQPDSAQVRAPVAESFDRLEFDEGKAGLESLGLALSQSWAVVIVALDLPDRDGLEMLAILKGLRPHQPILVLASRAGHFTVASTPDEMVSAVRRLVASGTIGQTTGPIPSAPPPKN
jgi:CheY-like chemotaxis protein